MRLVHSWQLLLLLRCHRRERLECFSLSLSLCSLSVNLACTALFSHESPAGAQEHKLDEHADQISIVDSSLLGEQQQQITRLFGTATTRVAPPTNVLTWQSFTCTSGGCSCYEQCQQICSEH